MPGHRLVFGLDANTYEHGSGSKQGVVEFGQDFVSKGYSSCWGDAPDPTKHTTYNARTFLQSQLQKAARSTEKASKGDKNPKDFILFPKAAYSVVATTKDNTGLRSYTEGMVFPTLQFPSDHGLVATVLREGCSALRRENVKISLAFCDRTAPLSFSPQAKVSPWPGTAT
eukprot:scaffold90772_cov60-Phaeocystis_antarctica.AAC.3